MDDTTHSCYYPGIVSPSSRIVVYTSIFGGYEALIPQPRFPNVDYVCFSDRPMKPRGWRVEVVEPRFDSPARSSRYYKILPHRTLGDYDVSVYMDGNYLIVGDIEELVRTQLAERDMAVFDHAQTRSDPRGCIYQEYEAIVSLGRGTGKYKDDPDVMARQIARYREAGYPENNGLVFAAVLLRRHNDPVVIRTMDTWWDEFSNFSRRDQLSLPYACWKEGLDYQVIDGDLRSNPYFYMLSHHNTSYTAALWRYRLRKLFGYVKHR